MNATHEALPKEGAVYSRHPCQLRGQPTLWGNPESRSGRWPVLTRAAGGIRGPPTRCWALALRFRAGSARQCISPFMRAKPASPRSVMQRAPSLVAVNMPKLDSLAIRAAWFRTTTRRPFLIRSRSARSSGRRMILNMPLVLASGSPSFVRGDCQSCSILC